MYDTFGVYKSLYTPLGTPLLSPRFTYQLECGPMPNVLAALLNIGGALCSTPQSSADTH